MWHFSSEWRSEKSFFFEPSLSLLSIWHLPALFKPILRASIAILNMYTSDNISLLIGFPS
uniref:Uncharacterized protein n=1 Tax=Arundo donax TaxID=35708 RepID=A0A0A9DP58_ARUDO